MQHPVFDEFKRAFNARNFELALKSIDQLREVFPNSAALLWHRATCLEKLERFVELPMALEAAITKLPEHLPARLMRVEYSDWYIDHTSPVVDGDDDLDEDDLAPDVLAIREQRELLLTQLEARNEADLRFILAREPQHARANFLLSNLLRTVVHHALSAEERETQASELLERAIINDPKNPDYYLTRAAYRRSLAWSDDSKLEQLGESPSHIVKTDDGLCLSREWLEAAAQDYRQAWHLSQQPGHALKLATILDDIGAYDEALAVYDEALLRMASDAPLRDYFLERRAMSAHRKAGELEARAQLQPQANENQEDSLDLAQNTAAAPSHDQLAGAQATASEFDDDPDALRAISVARQLVNLASEPIPDLVEVSDQHYPVYQRRFADRVERAALKVGIFKICDAEAMGMYPRLGQHVMLRFYRDESGEVGMASFILKHKWTGMINFLRLCLKGKWRAHSMVECVTTFDDGTLLSTQPESFSPFNYGGSVIIRRLAKNVSVQELVTVHRELVADYKLQHPHAQARIVNDLAGIEARWIEGQDIKASYRKSINYVTDTELRSMLGVQYETLAEKVRTQIQLMTSQTNETSTTTSTATASLDHLPQHDKSN